MSGDPSITDDYARTVGGEMPLDRGIVDAVKMLRDYGIETFESCDGSPGHAMPEPTGPWWEMTFQPTPDRRTSSNERSGHTAASRPSPPRGCNSQCCRLRCMSCCCDVSQHQATLNETVQLWPFWPPFTIAPMAMIRKVVTGCISYCRRPVGSA